MNPRVSELIDLLELEPHVGGGYVREIFRSASLIHLQGNQEERKALTTIYYLLGAGEYDRWHQLDSDEVWHYYEGAKLELFWIEPGGEKYTRCLMGEVGDESRPIAVVPGGCWQMARTTGEYTLVIILSALISFKYKLSTCKDFINTVSLVRYVITILKGSLSIPYSPFIP